MDRYIKYNDVACSSMQQSHKYLYIVPRQKKQLLQML